MSCPRVVVGPSEGEWVYSPKTFWKGWNKVNNWKGITPSGAILLQALYPTNLDHDLGIRLACRVLIEGSEYGLSQMWE